jgi:diguanylate cyclase (GGDEF)-like protein/PAS domain S-box-containing protein
VTAGQGTRKSPIATQLRTAEAKYRALVEHLPAVVYIAEFGTSGRWTYVSPQIEDLLGFSVEEWLSDPERWFKQIHPDDQQQVLLMEEISRSTGSPLNNEYRMLTKDGRLVWVTDQAFVVRDERGDPLFLQGVLTNITSRKELEQELRHQAFHDSLTGLANRALFSNRIEHALARVVRHPKSIAVLLLDLDDFKEINDSLGHAAGDQLLMELGRRLTKSTRPSDTIARMGGDEFAILVEDVDNKAINRIARRIRDVLAAPFQIAGKEVVVHASLGIARTKGGEETPDDLLRKADVAMYTAKGEGGNRCRFFERSMQLGALERRQLKADLQIAMNERQFIIHYQPIVQLQTGGLTGVEALVRWNHPGRGLLFPDSFISIAEESGLIVELGRWVLQEACRQAEAWRTTHEGRSLAVSVNLSPRQLADESFTADVVDALDKSQLEPGCLIVEITENILMNSMSQAIANLGGLRSFGVRVAVDDFGTGYSSFSYLRTLPVDILKIAKPFVDEVGSGDPEGSAIARSIVKIGHDLSLQTIAEGIELPEQLWDLQRMGCAMGQGYYLGRPMEASKVDELLMAGSSA